MNVLFLTLLDFSSIDERGIYTDLMREFSKKNHNIFIISPTEKRKNQPPHLIDNGKVKILKLQIGNTQKTNSIEKGISTLAIEGQFKRGIKKYFNNIKFDLVIYSTPPITILKAIEYVKKRDNAKTYLLLKDIFPQNAVDLGMFSKRSILYKYFRRKERKLYKISDVIGTMSEANSQYILENNLSINTNVVEVTPNSIEPVNININSAEKKKIRKKFNIPELWNHF